MFLKLGGQSFPDDQKPKNGRKNMKDNLLNRLLLTETLKNHITGNI